MSDGNFSGVFHTNLPSVVGQFNLMSVQNPVFYLQRIFDSIRSETILDSSRVAIEGIILKVYSVH